MVPSLNYIVFPWYFQIPKSRCCLPLSRCRYSKTFNSVRDPQCPHPLKHTYKQSWWIRWSTQVMEWHKTQAEDLCAAIVMPEVQPNDRHTAYHLSQSKKPHRPNCLELLFQYTSSQWIFSLLPLWVQPVSLVFNYLSQYGSIQPQHVSQIIKCIYKGSDIMAISEGQWKLHWWFAAQEVNKVIIYEGNNTQIWLQTWSASGQMLLSTNLTRGCVDALHIIGTCRQQHKLND